MKIQRNYDDFEEQEGFSILPDGTYMFEIAEKEDTYSSKGDVMINITLRCIEEDRSGALVWDRILIPLPESPSHKVIGRTKRFLHSIGEPYQGNFDVDTDNWVGKTIEAKISKGEWNGRPKNVIDKYNLQAGNKDVNTSNSQPKSNKQEEPDLPF